MSKKIIRADLGTASTDYTSQLDADIADTDKIIESVNNFIDNSKTKLKGKGYDAVRAYLGEVYIPLLTERKSLAENIKTSITSANGSMDTYTSPYTSLDDSQYESIDAAKTECDNQLSELNLSLNQTNLSTDAINEINRKIGVCNDNLAIYNPLLEKLKGLAAEDNTISTSNFDSASDSIANFCSKIGNISTLTNAFTDTSAVDGLASQLDNSNPQSLGSPSSTGSPSSAGSPSSTGSDDNIDENVNDEIDENENDEIDENENDEIDENENDKIDENENDEIDENEDEEIDNPEIPNELISLASGMVGSNINDLIEDENSSLPSSQSYKEDEEWGNKAINDIICRDPESKKLLEDFYENEEDYPNAYTDPNELLNYAKEDNSNITYVSKENLVDDPKEGDIVFINTDSEKDSSNKIGIIKSVETIKDEDGKEKKIISVIEGDVPSENGTSTINEVKYEYDSDKIVGYGTIEKNNSSESTPNKPTPNEPTPNEPTPNEPTPNEPDFEESDIVWNWEDLGNE